MGPRPRARRRRPPRLRRGRAALPRGRRRAVGAPGAVGHGSAGRRAAGSPRPGSRSRAWTRGRSFTIPTRPRGARPSKRPCAAADVAAALGAAGIRVFGDRVQPGPTSRRRAAGSPSRSPSCATECAAAASRSGSRRTATSPRPRPRASCSTSPAATGSALVWDPANAFSEFGEEPEGALPALGSLVAPRTPQGRAAARRRPDPLDAGAPRGRRLPVRPRPLVALALRLRRVGLVRVGEALASGDRGAGARPAALRALGGRHAARPTRPGAVGGAARPRGPPARRGVSGPAGHGRRRGPRRGRRATLADRTRRPRQRHLRLGTLAGRVPRGAARRPGDRVVEARRVPPRRVRRDRARPPGVVSPLPRRPPVRPRARRRVPRPGRSRARRGGRVRPLRGAARGTRTLARPARHRRERPPRLRRPADVRLRRAPRRARRGARRALPRAAGPRRRLRPRRGRASVRAVAHGAVPDARAACRGDRARPGEARSGAGRLAGPLTTACPASILRRHRDATLFLDEASAVGLG